MRRSLEPLGLGDVSIMLPLAAIVVSFAVGITGHGYVGIGITIGALLAFLNSGLLVKRIDVAAMAPNPGAALIAMQLGLLITFTVVGGLTLVMIHISVQMTVAMAISFLVSQTGELIFVYRARKARSDNGLSDVVLTGKGA